MHDESQHSCTAALRSGAHMHVRPSIVYVPLTASCYAGSLRSHGPSCYTSSSDEQRQDRHGERDELLRTRCRNTSHHVSICNTAQSLWKGVTHVGNLLNRGQNFQTIEAGERDTLGRVSDFTCHRHLMCPTLLLLTCSCFD